MSGPRITRREEVVISYPVQEMLILPLEMPLLSCKCFRVEVVENISEALELKAVKKKICGLVLPLSFGAQLAIQGSLVPQVQKKKNNNSNKNKNKNKIVNKITFLSIRRENCEGTATCFLGLEPSRANCHNLSVWLVGWRQVPYTGKQENCQQCGPITGASRLIRNNNTK